MKNLRIGKYPNDQDLNTNCEMPNPKTDFNLNEWHFCSRNFNHQEPLGINSNNPNSLNFQRIHQSTLPNFQHRNMSSILRQSNKESSFVEQPSIFPKSNVGFFNKDFNMDFTSSNKNGCYKTNFTLNLDYFLKGCILRTI